MICDVCEDNIDELSVLCRCGAISCWDCRHDPTIVAGVWCQETCDKCKPSHAKTICREDKTC